MRVLILLFAWVFAASAASLKVATYNLEMYLDQPTQTVPVKSEMAKKQIRASIKLINPDVIAVQEIGSTNALLELRESLKKEGQNFGYWSYVNGKDQFLRVAFLSKLPIIAERHHRSEDYLYQGQRRYVLRGFGEVDVDVGKGEKVTLLTTHLKSQRIVAEGDQQEMREQEAILLREKIDAFFKREPAGKLIVLGDFNDRVTSKTLRAIMGRGKFALHDTRPAERNGDNMPNANPRFAPRNVVWTHFFAKEETYSRIDYILVSPSLRNAVVADQTYVLNTANWGAGSDHRPVTVGLQWQ